MRYLSASMIAFYALFAFSVLIVVALFAKLFFGLYADSECLERGYRISRTTIKGDIYCSSPFGERDHPAKIDP